ncbi:MAG: PrsW family glutamic-type intramembrane protease [Anaerolineae bacterium]|jgi:RsiW-degrading membrane proteinase PrsW (M82 family)|nr:PrsW family glutamic-type intramembrane protease [Anaerolineae bacterium]
MTISNPTWLTPPTEEEDRPIYRPVWRSIILQYGILLGFTAVLFVLANYLRLRLPPSPLINLGIVFLPLGLWIWFSFRVEQLYLYPRRQLFSIVIISALVAQAVGVPLVEDFLQVENWLSLAPAIDRIVGYTFTVGIVQEFLKYLIVRFMTWQDHLRERADCIAYAEAAALGYALVVSLRFALTGTPTPDVVAAHVFATVVVHLVAGIVVSYGLSESKFAESIFLLPASLALAALVTGIAIPIRAGLVNASLSPAALEFALPRPLFGIGFSATLLFAGLWGISFLYRVAQRRDRESRAAQEV